MMLTFFRDLAFLIGCFVIYDIFLINGVITMYEAVFLSCLTILYIYIILRMNKHIKRKEKERKLERG
jgi:Ca2+/Na+ antiporter